MLLSGLLNSAAANQRTSKGLQDRLQPRPRKAAAAPVGEVSRSSSLDEGTSKYSAEFSELLPAASGSAVSLASNGSEGGPGSGVAEGRQPTQPLLPAGEDEPSADSVAAAAAERSSQRKHSFQDAADDTVLTGSPQASAAGSSRVGSPSAGSPTADADLRFPDAGALPAVQAFGRAAAQQAAGDSCAAPTSQQAPPRPPTAPRSRLPKPPPKAAIAQQQWNFESIPQGTASIPSRVPAPERRPAAAAAADGGSRPAFFTRAASPPPRPLAALPAAAGAQTRSTTEGGAQESRRERLERLAQPKRSAPSVRRQPVAAAPAAASRAGRLGNKPATAAGSKRVSAATECGVIAAWRPGQAQGAAGTAEPAAEAAARITANAPPAAGGRSLPQQAASSSCAEQLGGSTHRRWPAALGRPLDGAELARATGAYSEERFQAHLARLQQALAPHRQRRQNEAEAASAGELPLLQGGWV